MPGSASPVADGPPSATARFPLSVELRSERGPPSPLNPMTSPVTSVPPALTLLLVVDVPLATFPLTTDFDTTTGLSWALHTAEPKATPPSPYVPTSFPTILLFVMWIAPSEATPPPKACGWPGLLYTATVLPWTVDPVTVMVPPEMRPPPPPNTSDPLWDPNSATWLLRILELLTLRVPSATAAPASTVAVLLLSVSWLN